MIGKELLVKMADEAKGLWPSDFSEYEKLMNRCCLSICVDIIKKHDILQKKNEKDTFASIKNKMRLRDEADYLLGKLLYILREDGIIKRENDDYICVEQDIDIESPAESLMKLTRAFPEEGATLQWLSRAYGGMQALIKGNAYPEDILFPWGDLSLIEDLYFTSRIYAYYSILAGKCVAELINGHYKKKIRALEIGAGTGNGTHNILESVPDGFEGYAYTDIGRSLIKKGAKRFEDRPFMDFKLYDICSDPEGQGIGTGEYDMVIGVNVLHATADATEAAGYMHKILKKGGMLVISEVSPPQNSIYRYMELTFGLIPSYNAYKDKAMRPDSPLVTQGQWIEIFKKAGFSEAYGIPESLISQQDASHFRGGVIIGIK